MCEGYRKIEDAYTRVHIKNLPMISLTFGKRFPLNPRLRIQTTLEGGVGSVADNEHNIDGFKEDDGVGFGYFWYYYHVYVTGGAAADLHLLFPSAASTRTYYLSAGPGFHLTYRWDAIKTTTPSASLNLGAGMEYKILKKSGMSMGYNLRLWTPTKYNYIGNTFPRGVDQKEFHITHSLQTQLLLPKRGR